MKRIRSYRELSESKDKEFEAYINIKTLDVSEIPEEYDADAFKVSIGGLFHISIGTISEMVSEILRDNERKIVSKCMNKELVIVFSDIMRESLMSQYGTSDMDEIEPLLKTKSRIEFSDDYSEIFQGFESKLQEIAAKWNAECQKKIMDMSTVSSNPDGMAWIDVI